jgi:AcrR family transcriptional regulator
MPTMTDTATISASAECFSRADVRRAQILEAAAQCFRTHGFHGASIASISQLAGMSTGHIYHYFANKEAIIAAIVQRDLEHMLTTTAKLRTAGDVREAMIAHVAEGALHSMDAEIGGLRLEIVAEAARNPEVARVVRAADCCCIASMMATWGIARRAGGMQDDDVTFSAMNEVIAAMFEGLMLRAIRNPDLNQQRVAKMVQYVVRLIIDDPQWSKV